MDKAVEIGHVDAIFRYPVKSMRGEQLDAAMLGWHGIEGDRRLAFHRTDDHGGFPWLTATKLPELILFAPQRRVGGADNEIPTHVRTPDGDEMDVFGDELAAEIGKRHGAPVRMIQMRQGIFDDAHISVIASDTVREISRLAGCPSDARRFRPNIVARLTRATPFQEDEWLGGTLSFGSESDGPAVSVTVPDVRCAMVNLDPDSARRDPEMLKTVVRVHDNTAGIYATVIRTGRLEVRQSIFLQSTPARSDQQRT